MNAGCDGTTPSVELLEGQKERVLAILEEYLREREQGRATQPADLLTRYPDLAEMLAPYLETLEMLDSAAVNLRGAFFTGETLIASGGERNRIGDFEIIREVGRGGMGIVYEAEQLSLGRRVALKTLPFAAGMDAKQLQRFKNEAQAAASLHHNHIVPIYAVGTERGVHYYAMQFIDGQTVADLIANLRQEADPGNQPAESGQADGRTTHFLPTPPVAGLSTQRSSRSPVFFRSVAQLARQAAEALEHAHQLGVVHRDVKPANLLLDGSGRLWVTDFGLARWHADQNLTVSGDVVGTLRYMSPEQALAKRGLVDHRSDLYSLGATLYELLTQEPAFSGPDRQALLNEIIHEDPRAPRSLNPALPIELETIVLKALAKEPQRRYGTAQELADDLQRFLEDRPVLARRPTLREHLSKWVVRHKSIVASAVVMLALALAGSLLTTWMVLREAAEAQRQRDKAEVNFNKALTGMRELLTEFEDAHYTDVSQFRRDKALRGVELLKPFLSEASSDTVSRFETARTYELIATVYMQWGQAERSIEAMHRAFAYLDGLLAEDPQNRAYLEESARAHELLANLYSSLERFPEAREEFTRSEREYRQILPQDKTGKIANTLAWRLVTCRDESLRDPIEAVKLAEQAVALAPASAGIRNTLAVAYYRRGDLSAAKAAFEESIRRSGGGGPCDWFPLAMIAWRTGDHEQARHWYERAVQEIKQTKLLPPEFVLFWAESEQVMGLPHTDPLKAVAGSALDEKKP